MYLFSLFDFRAISPKKKYLVIYKKDLYKREKKEKRGYITLYNFK